MLWYGDCVQKGALAELYSLPGMQYISALLLPAALALHVWATETLGKVGVCKVLHHKLKQHNKVFHIYVLVDSKFVYAPFQEMFCWCAGI